MTKHSDMLAPGEATAEQDLRRKIGYSLLGPVVHRWLMALDQYVSYFDDGDTRFLYCSRAGGRIAALYDIYLEGQGRTRGASHQMFWVSRMALCKGTFDQNPTRASQVIESEYYHQTVRHAVAGLMRNADQDELDRLLSGADLKTPGYDFGTWIDSGSPAAKTTRTYLKASSTAFDSYLQECVDGADRAVLIDSGWQGTSQSLLTRAYSDITWQGLYIGRILTSHHDTHIVDQVIGLLFQGESYDPEFPETAITAHRHLFETLLESNGPSIEEIVGGPRSEIAKTQIEQNQRDTPSKSNDELFLYVRDYLTAHTDSSFAEILARHQKAMPALARILVQPTQSEAKAILCKPRSADFGRDIVVPVLNPTEEDTAETADLDADQRVQQALWTQGQIALEYEGELARELQNRVTGLTGDHDYFDPHSADPASTETDLAKVSVITRTKNRPLLLKRAALSVAAQTYPELEWIVVNDGGDEAVVRDVIENCAVERSKIQLVSHPKSLGMEAASNAGIERASGDYVLIHDDDDSLHPDFLKRTVRYLESGAGDRYGGVVTHSDYVSEEISGDAVIEHGRQPFMNWVQNVQISEMLAQNLFPPIAFVFRRSVYDDIGGYNEDLPVLGDWFFNLEFLMRADIKVIPEPLAYYHHRDRGDSSKSGVYSNSVIGGQSKHEEFASVARNMFMRKYDGSTIAGGAIQAYFASDVRNRLNPLAGARPSDGGSHLWDEIDRLWVVAHLARVNTVWRLIRGAGLSRGDVNRSMDELRRIIIRTRANIPVQPGFDEAAYLRSNVDVGGVVNAGKQMSGYRHYLLHGRPEGRRRPFAQ